MDINTISSTSQNAAAPTPAKNSYLDQDTFLRLLVVQLETQDPLSPMTDRDFFAQLAQLGTVQGIDQLKQSNDLGQASAMIGKTVQVFHSAELGGTGAYVDEGVVQGAQVVSGNVYILVNGAQYKLDQVMKITDQ